jgi:hypothetical protein
VIRNPPPLLEYVHNSESRLLPPPRETLLRLDILVVVFENAEVSRHMVSKHCCYLYDQPYDQQFDEAETEMNAVQEIHS